ncbi:carbohydrate-binding protein [Streptomyces sp. NPDC001137]|uniref:carbohydrate-binding protein n=1 Tax=Streptomyces sp. NPDC001137 TaxID=3154378 RepID=UPI0033305E7E
MTSGNNGASTPEDDDPFGYLYADGQANGAQPPSGGGGYGYPGSVNRVRAVGQRQYGQPAQAQQTAAYGQVPQQQGAYGQPSAHYAAPETLPGGGAPTAPQQPAYSGGGGRRGPNTKGLLIGAIAVVAAVVIGIGVAMMNGNSKDDKAGGGSSSTPSTSQSSKPSQSASSNASAELPKSDAKDLQLGGTAAKASDVQGAGADGGVYVGNLNNVGSSVTWTIDNLSEDGAYTLFATYSVPGQDQSMTLLVNGKPFGQKFNLGNFAHAADGDFVKGWTRSYVWPDLKKGPNTLTLTCQAGDKCNVLLDQLYLKKGHVKS